jgi:hypothetical protein
VTSPRVAYLLMSHKNPAQVEALAARVLELSGGGQVVVHHDGATAEPPWGGRPPDGVHLVDPLPVKWGDWSLVEAALALLRFAQEQLEAQWCVFLSGEDRPVMDLAAWEASLPSSGVDGYVDAHVLDTRPRLGRPPNAVDLNYARYALRWRTVLSNRHPLMRRILGPARRVSRYLQPVVKIEYASRRQAWMVGWYRRRRLPPGWNLYCGSQWMALGRRAVDVLLSTEPWVTDWFRQTWIPDQGYFHTVLYNHPELKLSPKPLTYFVPHVGKKQEAWMFLRAADADAITRSGAVFARKFDPAVDAEVIDLLDAVVDAAVSTRRETRSPEASV